MKTIYTVFLLLLLLSCTSSSEKLAWEIANNSQTNKKELTRFLEPVSYTHLTLPTILRV